MFNFNGTKESVTFFLMLKQPEEAASRQKRGVELSLRVEDGINDCLPTTAESQTSAVRHVATS